MDWRRVAGRSTQTPGQTVNWENLKAKEMGTAGGFASRQRSPSSAHCAPGTLDFAILRQYGPDRFAVSAFGVRKFQLIDDQQAWIQIP